MDFYSQNGEDFLLWQVFQDQKTGFFLDVGALDGIHFSNSYAFERAGWQGVCVEACPTYHKKLCVNRPKTICENYAISDVNENQKIFYASSLGSFSSISPKFVTFFKQRFAKYKPKWEEILLDYRTIDSVLEKNKVSHVDFVSLDIEGTEYEALSKFDIKKYQPRVLCVEILGKQRFKMINKLLDSYGYKMARKLKQNAFYAYTKQDIAVLVEGQTKCNLVR